MKALSWSIFSILIFFFFNPSYAWTIGAKGRVTGPVVHTTYFLTPNNQVFPVRAFAYVGAIVNGSCQYTAIYDVGTEQIGTGDFVEFSAFNIKSLIGGGYSCMILSYTYRQIVRETIRLFWDGGNYYTSIPATSEVSIL